MGMKQLICVCISSNFCKVFHSNFVFHNINVIKTQMNHCNLCVHCNQSQLQFKWQTAGLEKVTEVHWRGGQCRGMCSKNCSIDHHNGTLNALGTSMKQVFTVYGEYIRQKQPCRGWGRSHSTPTLPSFVAQDRSVSPSNAT